MKQKQSTYHTHSLPFTFEVVVLQDNTAYTVSLNCPKGGKYKADYFGQCNDPNCLFNEERYHGDFQCYFTKAGIYRISLYGTFPGFRFHDVRFMGSRAELINKYNKQDSLLLKHVQYVNEYINRIERDFDDKTDYSSVIDYAAYLWNVTGWGNNSWLKMDNMFEGCKYVGISALDAPDLRNVTSLDKMFCGCKYFNSYINHWNVSHIRSMNGTFKNASCFNKPLQNWNVSRVKEMAEMFSKAFSFNQALDSWNVSHVRDMSNMFLGAKSFRQSLEDWELLSLRYGSYRNLGLDEHHIQTRKLPVAA